MFEIQLTITDKGAYLQKDRMRWIKKFGIPISESFPEPFPQPTIQALRALCAIKAKHPDKLSAAFVELYNALWLDLKPVGKAEVFAQYLNRIFSESEVKEIVEMSSQPEIKKQLVDNTDYALKEGCFGLPYYIATNVKGESEAFWGFDHLGQVIDHLGLERQGEGFRAML
ncbi:hypothetical protein AMS68_006811 [Peltaster fructicola]|uniref:DSBA-like thioredoxin domain-containing protein n=1 Tax=Peltaster fructicola TaxID=286661 RepID=A0A6H0Y2Q2_9PEZI|nr:hypothetical protein AMS68_006811 [Peltaster fructicola]